MGESDRLSAIDMVTTLVDEGTWRSWDTAPAYVALDATYAAALGRARRRTGVDESVITGVGEVSGSPIVLVVSEFGFLAGSIGQAAGERVVAAVRRATRERLPVLALPASGGTRMQEGTVAFLQMAAIAEAVECHRRAGLLYLVYLRDPTTGGVFASWGSMGHITWAEPGALIGFLGPRVFEGLHHTAFPEGVQVSENLAAQGIVDALVPVDELAQRVGSVVDLLVETDDSPAEPISSPAEPTSSQPEPTSSLSGSAAMSSWDHVRATRAPHRPGLRQLLTDETAVIHDVGPIILALSRFGRTTAVVIGQDRAVQAQGRLVGPADLRVARRGMVVATELRRPVVERIEGIPAAGSAAAPDRNRLPPGILKAGVRSDIQTRARP